jgi:hypothetical protein
VVVECRDSGGRAMDVFIPRNTVRSIPAGDPVQDVMAGILDDAKGDTPPSNYLDNWGLPNTGLYVDPFWDIALPIDPGWNIREFRLEPGPLLQALNTLAEQIGWSLRFWFDETVPGFRLALMEPDRNQAFANVVVDDSVVLDASAVNVNIADIRNEVWVAFTPNDTVTQPMTVPTIPSGTGTAAPGEFFYGDPGSYASASIAGGAEEDNRVIYRVRSDQLDASEEGADSNLIYGTRRMMVAESSSSNIDTPEEAQQMAVAMLRDLQQPKVAMNLRVAGMHELELGDIIKIRQNGQWFSSDQQMAVVGLAHTFSSEGVTTDLQLRGRPTLGTTVHTDKEARPGTASVPTIDNVSAEMQSGMTTRGRRQLHQALMTLSDQYLRMPRTVANIRNGDFSSRSQGERPPDTWDMAAGTWNTDAALVRNASESGRNVVRLLTLTAEVRSDFIPVAPRQTINAEFRVRVSDANHGLQCAFDLYDRDRAFLTRITSDPAEGGQYMTDTLWRTAQLNFIMTEYDTAFVRVVVAGDPVDDWSGGVYMDVARVAVSQSDYLSRADKTSGGNVVITPKTPTILIYPGHFTTQPRGKVVTSGSTSVDPYDTTTGYFTAPDPGIYEFSAAGVFDRDPANGFYTAGYIQIVSVQYGVIAESPEVVGGNVDPNKTDLVLSCVTGPINILRFDQIAVYAWLDKVNVGGANPSLKWVANIRNSFCARLINTG